MKKLLLLAASAVCALVLPGCLQHHSTIRLNKDGSGTLVEETLLGAQMLGMLDQMAAGFGGGGAAPADPTKEMFSEEKAKKRAAELGEGVTFEKSEPVSKDGSKGARVTFRFKDINQLKVTTGDGMKQMSPPGMPGAAEAAPKKQEPIAFTYKDGTLSVRMPKPEQPENAEKPAQEAPDKMPMDSPEAQAMMKQMMGDMKMTLRLIIEPGIAETTASHQDGNTITLMEMDFGKIVENADGLKKLGSVDQKDPTAAMEALKGIAGMKFEPKQEITVKVK